MKISETQKSKINDFCSEHQIALFIIFGSQVKGKTHSNSDLDIALSFEDHAVSINKLRLIFELEGIFEKQVDLVVLNPKTDPLLRFEIFSMGKPFFMSKPHLFEEARLYAWKLYLDTEKIRTLKAQYVKNYIRKLKHDFRSHLS
jgi:predicted nucleotidyltransferase